MPSSLLLPFALKHFAGVGGVIKQRPEDFFVQEIPLYEPSGDGEHVLAEIEKINLSTFDALDVLARQLKVNRRDIGYAGMKDAQAVSRQLVSIPRVTPEAVMDVKTDLLTVKWAARHHNKLRLGHLQANRFAIKIREVDPMRVVALRPALNELAQRGMPNYFGEQRFGRRGNNDLLGAALIRNDYPEVLRLLLGDPTPDVDDEQSLAARQAYEIGDLATSHKAWPHWARAELVALTRLMKSNDPEQAVMSVEMSVRRLWISALQSRLFNALVAERIDDLGRLLPGDLAYKHDNGACFIVEDPAIEQPRADRFEISPTGPMIGEKMSLPRDRAMEIEQSIFDRYKLSPDDFRNADYDRSAGERRPIRVQPIDTFLEGGVDEHGPFITVAFTLPPGSFATVLLRELMRSDVE